MTKRRKKPSKGIWIEENNEYKYIFENPIKIDRKRISEHRFDFNGKLLYTNHDTYLKDMNNDQNHLDYDSRLCRKLTKTEVVLFKLTGKL